MAPVSRAVRRRIAQHQASVDKVVNADVRFFERHPEREFRIRVASRAEMAQYCAMERVDVAETRPGYAWYVLVRQVEPGVRIRVPAQGPAHHDVDLSEDVVRRLWAQIVPEGSAFARVEQDLERSIARRDAP